MNKSLSGALRRKIKGKDIRIAVVGLGYVGLPLALEFARKGIRVLGIETDAGRRESLKKKVSYITDVPTLALRRAMAKRRFTAVGDFRPLAGADVIIVCVPTPLKANTNRPDISYIVGAVSQIKRYLRRGHLVILESTTYPGTTDEVIQPLLEKSGLACGDDFFLAFSPERIDPGNKSYPVNKIPKIVGGQTPEATRLAALVYRHIVREVVEVSSARIAETAKLLENTFRIVNIGLIDEIAMMAHQMGIDIWEVIAAARTKPFGFMPFYPGPGVGGHCIPKDPLYLFWKAKKFGFHSRFIKLASDVITRMPAYVIERVERGLRARGVRLSAASVLVVGATYKRDIKDLRKSPALDMIALLERRARSVAYHDPLIPFLKIGTIDLRSVRLDAAAVRRHDCVIIATDHSTVDYRLIARCASYVFDARNAYGPASAKNIERL